MHEKQRRAQGTMRRASARMAGRLAEKGSIVAFVSVWS